MTDLNERALLPPGLGDVLAPDAQFEADAVERLMATYGAYGYRRVKPPLIEFETSLLAGKGTAIAAQTFRMMDPVSQKMLAIRPDMTLQVARIAATRLTNAPRPLRLSYAGQVLRIKGSQMRPERQFGQVGAELIGSTNTEADGEVILMALDALDGLGVQDLSVDLGQPTLVPAITGALADGINDRLRQALDRKDAAAVQSLAGDIGSETVALIEKLLGAVGPAQKALDALAALDLGGAAAAARDELAAVVALLHAARPGLTITIDPVENRGFEYHTGVTFTFFAKGARGELGCGGRYITDAGLADNDGEPATGFSLFMDSVLSTLAPVTPTKQLFLPHGTALANTKAWQAEGWVTVLGMNTADTPEQEARRLGCTHILDGDTPRPLIGAAPTK